MDEHIIPFKWNILLTSADTFYFELSNPVTGQELTTSGDYETESELWDTELGQYIMLTDPSLIGGK